MNMRTRQNLELIVGLIVLIGVGVGVMLLIVHLNEESTAPEKIGLGSDCTSEVGVSLDYQAKEVTLETGSYQRRPVTKLEAMMDGSYVTAQRGEQVSLHLVENAPHMLRVRAHYDASGKPGMRTTECHVSFVYE